MNKKIRDKIFFELSKNEFPDLALLYSKEYLDISLEILEELLEKDKNNFEKLLNIPNEKLTFDSFQDESLLDYYWSLLNHLKSVNSGEKIREIIDTFRPKIEEFGNYIAYNKTYFYKLKYIYDNCDLDSEQKRIMYLRVKAFKDRGIDLNEQKQDTLKNINLKLSKLSDDFNNNIVDDESLFEYIIEDFEIIKDLPKEILVESKEKAKLKNKKGYLFDADPTVYQSIMKFCSSSEVRQDFENFKNSLCSSGKFDNRKIILEILKLKNKKAKILSYNNYAEYSLNNKMAKSPKQVINLIEGISKKAKIKSKQEIDELKNYFNLENLNSYDLSFYARKYKQEKYDIDEKQLKQYFEYKNTLDYLFSFIEKFFGLNLKKLDIKSYNDDILIYEVYKNKKLISYYFVDLFYNKNKRSGAWADNLREKTYLYSNKIPIITNVCNFQKTSGVITLYMRDVETIFHEFGHAIHEILSESKYSELSGFGVEWDFVELPSQILENWVNEKESLKKLSKHIEFGEQLDSYTIDKLDKLKTYMSGVFVLRQNEFALLDMNLYLLDEIDDISTLDKICLELVNKYSLFKRDKNYKMYCSFGHIFGGGYAAGYYSYMWAEILEADVFNKIKKEGIFDISVGEKFINTILGQGTRKKADELFCDFMGREVDDNAFLKRKGFL